MTDTATQLTVMKFGGSSLASAERLRHTAELVSGYRALNPVVVVSAMGGVTNALLALAGAASQGVSQRQQVRDMVDDLRRRHVDALTDLVHDQVAARPTLMAVEAMFTELRDMCMGVGLLGELSLRSRDRIAAYGEKLSSLLMAAALNGLGVPATAVSAEEIVVTDANFGAANPDMAATTARAAARIIPLVNAGQIPVVTGFIGATPDGVTTTLGRNASDYSAGLMGAVLVASEIWIWTDVTGVMSADPRVVPTARTIPHLSYLEATELAYFGSKVLHPRTIVPAAVEKGIPVRIKNTFEPESDGTLISAHSEEAPGVVKAITSINNLGLITLSGLGMLGVPGVAGRAFSAVAAQGANILMISQSSSESNVCFLVPALGVDGVLAALRDTFAPEVLHQDIETIRARSDVSIITVVGRGMRGAPGVAGRVFGSVGRAGVNVLAIAQGSSELSISFVAEASQADLATRAIHADLVETD